ncbi:hypothetical protein ACG0Z6_10145 [Roseateles sp. BYS180W]|uniref:Uncharacterized protein n=1 Tax=Roseateles rivi TaxID=3299028 RepID=A0ABW7FW98_9BURK
MTDAELLALLQGLECSLHSGPQRATPCQAWWGDDGGWEQLGPVLLDWAESELAAVALHTAPDGQAELRLRLAAAHLGRSDEAAPGQMSWGFSSGLQLCLALDAAQPLLAEQHAAWSAALGRVRQGHWVQGGQRHHVLALPLPPSWKDTALQLELAQGDTLQLQARGLRAQWLQPPQWRASCAC